MLRNATTEPPVVKVTNYRKDLMRKLFTKLGESKSSPKDTRAKAVHLTTTITAHDLNNKKRKATEYLKSYSLLKFFMKVNIYDEENIQKGRLMLLNLAEDLKEVSKIKVAPADIKVEKDEESKPSEKKPTTIE